MKSAKRILTITILLSVLYLPLQAYSKKGPRIVFMVDSYDLGKVPVGTIVSAEFPFFNDGDSPLVISRMKVEALEGC